MVLDNPIKIKAAMQCLKNPPKTVSLTMCSAELNTVTMCLIIMWEFFKQWIEPAVISKVQK